VFTAERWDWVVDEPTRGPGCAYCLGIHEDSDGTWRPLLSFEIQGAIQPAMQGLFEERIVARLYALNRDFREAMEEHPEGARPVIALHSLGTGPFAADETKIKQARLMAAH
jgi:hypothetical protein